ncbi:GIY-YIG nuclease family protein [Sphingopyxis sp. L1A2A]|uniref:GIY-YIG nuclease family protein n=1 Tax=Sphingopyxis sp. L1A2A TaxID=2502247 RepID=UPI00201630E9|nr:GIY-YIG nuclease family protein [Sphingopyxis sp. L1A2A]
MNRPGYLYLMASARNGTLYLGVTSDLLARVWQHRNEVVESFTKKYGCHRLVWHEAFDDIQQARHRELQMKKWKRAWKVELIERDNPQWLDLFDRLSL